MLAYLIVLFFWVQISIIRTLEFFFIKFPSSNDPKYSTFHKTLPNSSLQMHWISVRFYEMGVILIEYLQSSWSSCLCSFSYCLRREPRRQSAELHKCRNAEIENIFVENRKMENVRIRRLFSELLALAAERSKASVDFSCRRRK